MATKRVQKKAHENLTKVNIARVIELLAGKEPITKKVACEILNIAYNTNRLTKIIQEYKDRKATTARLRKANRGKKVTDFELQTIIECHLRGDSLVSISSTIYRSNAFIKAIINGLGIPQKPIGATTSRPLFLPESCVSEDFDTDEVAWSAQHHTPCIVLKQLTGDSYVADYGCKCYQVYITEPVGEDTNVKTGGFYAYCPAYDLGKLDHLRELGVRINV